MSKTIEEMIKSGCTYEEAMDALQNVWESTSAERERNIKEAEARQNMIADFKKYLQIVCPNISKKHLEQQVTQLESTLITVRDVYNKFSKINDLQLKSKEESKDRFEALVEKLCNKLDTKSKNAESVDKIDKARSKTDYNLDDFLKEMGW